MCNHCEHNSGHCEHGHNNEHCCSKGHSGTGLDNFLIKKLVIVFTALILMIILKPENLVSQLFHINSAIIKFAIYFTLYLIVAKNIVLNAFKNVLSKNFLDENFLMTIATFGAFGIGEYPEALMVMLLYQTGELFTDYAVNKSKKSVLALMDLKPEFANLVTQTDIQKVAPDKVKINDIILVKPGEKIPLDGTIVEGLTSIDTSALTGEALPKSLKPGDAIMNGCINLDGVIKIKVTSEFQNSTVSKIIEMVQQASDKKTRTENFITKFAKIYTPIVVFLALFLVIVPVIFGGAFVQWFERALTFLVISCPCALVISIPLGFFASIGAASKNGILIKGSNYIEALSKVDTIVFDKTGTLTSGVFSVSEICPALNISKEEFIKLAAHAEQFSNHPVASSIKSAYLEDVNPSDIKCLKEIPGMGITAVIQEKNIILGNTAIMEKFNIDYPKDIEGKTIIYMAINGKYAGYLTISDTIKPDTKTTLLNLKKEGVKELIVLTGDKGLFGLEELNNSSLIDEIYCNLLPNQKVEKLEELMKIKNHKTALAFVGDGINDAPVLSRADIGIAMGKMGSDAAIGASDVVIMDDNLNKISETVKISKKTIQIIKQNIIFILAVKFSFLAFGAFGMVSMWGAVFADVGVSILAILNSMRILYFTQPK